MAETPSQTRQIQGLLDRLRAGDESARDALINCACERLTVLTRQMLRQYPRVKRWEQTDDVFQGAAMRLYRTLGEVRPESVADFIRLAALNIRRELLDLARHYYGPQGRGANHATLGKRRDDDTGTDHHLEKPEATEAPDQLADWTEFHRQVEALPVEERTAFDLIWYQGLSQAEAAEILNCSERTVKRRWQSARLKLYEALQGEQPEK